METIFIQINMKYHYFFIGLLVVAFMSCKSQQPTLTQADKDAFNTLVLNQKYRVESDRAYPQASAAMQQLSSSGVLGAGNSAGTISLIGNQNFLTIKGDSITSYLPYFGERQMQVGYGGTDSAIEFNGVVKNYKVEKNKNDGFTIKFDAVSHSENFKVQLILSPNMKSNIHLSGASRNPISYSGILIPLE